MASARAKPRTRRSLRRGKCRPARVGKGRGLRGRCYQVVREAGCQSLARIVASLQLKPFRPAATTVFRTGVPHSECRSKRRTLNLQLTVRVAVILLGLHGPLDPAQPGPLDPAQPGPLDPAQPGGSAHLDTRFSRGPVAGRRRPTGPAHPPPRRSPAPRRRVRRRRPCRPAGPRTSRRGWPSRPRR